MHVTAAAQSANMGGTSENKFYTICVVGPDGKTQVDVVTAVDFLVYQIRKCTTPEYQKDALFKSASKDTFLAKRAVRILMQHVMMVGQEHQVDFNDTGAQQHATSIFKRLTKEFPFFSFVNVSSKKVDTYYSICADGKSKENVFKGIDLTELGRTKLHELIDGNQSLSADVPPAPGKSLKDKHTSQTQAKIQSRKAANKAMREAALQSVGKELIEDPSPIPNLPIPNISEPVDTLQTLRNTIQSLKEQEDQAVAAKDYAKAAELNTEVQNQMKDLAAEEEQVKLRAEEASARKRKADEDLEDAGPSSSRGKKHLPVVGEGVSEEVMDVINEVMLQFHPKFNKLGRFGDVLEQQVEKIEKVENAMRQQGERLQLLSKWAVAGRHVRYGYMTLYDKVEEALSEVIDKGNKLKSVDVRKVRAMLIEGKEEMRVKHEQHMHEDVEEWGVAVDEFGFPEEPQEQLKEYVYLSEEEERRLINEHLAKKGVVPDSQPDV